MELFQFDKKSAWGFVHSLQALKTFKKNQDMVLRIKVFFERHHLFAGVLLFAAFLIAVGYLRLLNHPPDFNHVWRQSDSVSLVKNYHYGGMNFLEPQTHNLLSNGGTSGHATSEMPYLYYLIAGLQHILGEEFWVYRLVWIVILVLGFASLYLLFFGWVESGLISFFASMLIFSSPVVVFYGNSFIPDVPAFCFAISGWVFFFKWHRNPRTLFLWLTAVFFSLAGLLKATAALSFFALAGVWILELLGLRLGEEGKRVFEKRWKAAIPFAVGFAVVVGWYLWAWRYNQINGTFLFSMQAHPIWESNQIEPNLIEKIFREIKREHLPMVASNFTLGLLGASILTIILFFRKANRLLCSLAIFLFLGVSAVFFLWFSALLYHDYYFIAMLILPVFVLLNLLAVTSKISNQNFYAKIFINGAFLGLVVLAIGHSQKMQKSRTGPHWQVNNYSAPLVQFLDDLSIKTTDKIITLPDPTPNHSLITLNRKGWSGFFGANDSVNFHKCLENGAKYLVVSDLEQTILKRPFLKQHLNQPMGVIGKTHLFRIDGNPASRFLNEKVDTIVYMVNNITLVSKDPISPLSETVPEGDQKSNANLEKASSLGLEPIETNPENQFALTSRTKIGKAKYAHVRIKRKEGPALLVVVLEGSKPLYVSNETGLPFLGTEWEEIIIRVSLDGWKPTDELVAYGWNNTSQTAFFSKLEILLYDSTVFVSGN